MIHVHLLQRLNSNRLEVTSNTSELSINHQLTNIMFVALFQETLRENMKYNCDELYCELNDLQVIFYSILLLNLNDSYKDYI